MIPYDMRVSVEVKLVANCCTLFIYFVYYVCIGRPIGRYIGFGR